MSVDSKLRVGSQMIENIEKALPQDRNERLPAATFDRQTVEHLHRYAVAQSFAHDLAVLDIACGEGYGSNLLAQAAKSVIGIDVDPAAVDRARQKYSRENLSFSHGSATAIDLPEQSVDLVVSFETLEHLMEHDEMLGELRRVLRPGGMLIMSTPDKREYSDRTGHKNPYHVRELYTDEFVALVGRHFKYLTLYKQKLLLNSVIVPVVRDAVMLDVYFGDMSRVSRANALNESKYNVLLATNSVLTRMNASVFDGQPALDDLVKGYYRSVFLEGRVAGLNKQIDDLRRSHSFRLGYALTAPLRWLRG